MVVFVVVITILHDPIISWDQARANVCYFELLEIYIPYIGEWKANKTTIFSNIYIKKNIFLHVIKKKTMGFLFFLKKKTFFYGFNHGLVGLEEKTRVCVCECWNAKKNVKM